MSDPNHAARVHAVKPYSWNILESRHPLEAMVRVGLTIPRAAGALCEEPTRPVDDESGSFVCTRVYGHGGRHAATLGDRTVVAVWGAA